MSRNVNELKKNGIHTNRVLSSYIPSQGYPAERVRPEGGAIWLADASAFPDPETVD